MLKSDGVRFLWKIHFCTNSGKKDSKMGYFAFFENFVICFSLKKGKMAVLLILYFLSQISYLTKFLFWSYWPICFWPIRLQDSLKCNICKKIEGSSWFLFADKHQSFLQVSSVAVGGRGQTCPKYLK